MAGKTIKGLTVEIGGDTTKLGKALDNVNKQSENLTGELRNINKLLKMDPGNADLLAQKQTVLSNAVSDTAKKLDILKEAEKQVQEQFKRGEASEAQVRELQREIITTTKQMENYERAAKETADAIKLLGDESGDAAKEVDHFADKADEAEEESENLGSSLDGTLSAGFTAVIGVATAAAAAIVGCVEGSQEYRREMGKLDTAFTANNHTSEAAKETYKELQSILGETDQAVEASNHLAKLTDTEEELSEWTNILTGVYGTFGASLPIEALAESANESARTGEIAGNLADALNWAAEEGETFGVAMKEATEENEEWNKAVEEAITAEDYFNLALQECTDEQERQQLITKTLTKLYGKAATQYKKTNKNVIEANKANEDWNETMAELGDEMAPAVTDIKKFGTEILKSAKEPLKDAAKFITGTVLPALSNLGKWASNNLPTIKAGLAGVAAALVTYKVATIAAEVAQKGLKGAIMATEAAQKLLNIAQAATPWGLAALAIGGVVTALTVYATETSKARAETTIMTDEQKAMCQAADEAADKLREQKTATQEAAGEISAQMGHITDLKDELLTLADASGKVKEKDQERATFILNELNEALGTEYTMTDGVIQKYDELKNNINAVIQSKTANSLIDAANEEYVQAIEQEKEAFQRLSLAEQDYQVQLAAVEEAQKKYDETMKYLTENKETMGERAYQARKNSAKGELVTEQNLLKEKTKAYDDALADYKLHYDTINDYEEAQTAILNGNYERAIEILTDKGLAYGKYSDTVDAETAAVLDKLLKEAVDAGLAAQKTKTNFEKGVKGYTAEMVTEAENGYNKAMEAYANAYADAEGVGADLGDGLKDGMEGKRGSLLTKARSLVSGILSAMRKEADSNSPSKKTMDFGLDMGEGTEIGLEKSTKDILSTARKQVQSLLTTYRDEGEEAGPQVLQGVSRKALSRNDQAFQTYANSNVSKLDKILAAIERGQVLTIDGKALVGATADKTDSALGQKRALVARGAM